MLGITFIVSSAGCGLLIGNVKPVDEKSDHYSFLDISKVDQEWKRINAITVDPGREDTDASDLAFQSKKTASIISVNSACRIQGQSAQQDLKELTRELLFGIADVTDRQEREIEIDRQKGLETTIQGRLNGEAVKLRAIVIRKSQCAYDLTYVSRPEHFAAQESVFSRFIEAFRMR